MSRMKSFYDKLLFGFTKLFLRLFYKDRGLMYQCQLGPELKNNNYILISTLQSNPVSEGSEVIVLDCFHTGEISGNSITLVIDSEPRYKFGVLEDEN